ncbi:endonuclease [Rhodococcus sp. 06-1477-1B]|uniref:Z1 domain-containing protein n=1 Tax=Rhodococcus sp. 06-1474-1B TaxID=2022499 RepID=UPI000B9BBDFA|nr:Z1 domain-containing protein [Rhodococcus sp. 06-1474-1B]OZD41619.1 endonuclease [Rhodococcus sp. 06-1477-1B]OZD54919.1 endonuclease [Rhodococcus sp. 06-1474-1B]
MSMDLVEAIARQFGDYPPVPLVHPVNAHLVRRFPSGIEIDVIVDVLVDENASEVRSAARTSFGQWDAESSASWTDGTEPGSVERRALTYTLLGIPEEAHRYLDDHYPRADQPSVIAAPQPWGPWYTPRRRKAHEFYWHSYRGVLAVEGWSDDAITGLDIATTQVVQRLADPTRSEPYQSKGLVVGYVQSGKTANFTGVLAKSIDAGYRLIIVLTGTIELLRSQTQRRLDLQLIGRQNIGSDPDYLGDPDWQAGRFVTHAVDPTTSNSVPAVRRLTGLTKDYLSLGKGIGALEFEKNDHAVPLNDMANLWGANVRIAVVKKNSTVLKKLVADLNKFPKALNDIPTLIIDDEADQASVNTVKPPVSESEKIERTAINDRIAELLTILPRAQYIGYTATPFANVFVDPDDSINIFPTDFIISLDRPAGYMGGSDFHDDHDEFTDEEKTPANSNERAFVRGLSAGSDDERNEELLSALDSFVLAGAIKLYREAQGSKPFRHHTMLVHESVKTATHKAMATDVRDLWKKAAYSQPKSRARLRALWTEDFGPVCKARARSEDAVPESFDDLHEFIGDAYDRISEGVSPVIVVNGEVPDEHEQEVLDFDARSVWKILVGGTKLSRGFTVAGLTTTYYTRRTDKADTLMQTGRWFGFRAGYKDLVRLFIGRNVQGPAGAGYDMYRAFEAIVRDEEEFRAELRRYKGINAKGEPMVTPRDVPPMVFQQLPWLKPTDSKKMFNAVQTYRGAGGESFSFTMQRPRGDGQWNKLHFDAVKPLLAKLTDGDTFEMTGSQDKRRTFDARFGVVPAQLVLDVVSRFVWDENWSFDPHLAAMKKAIDEKTLEDFAILLPKPKTRDPLPVAGWGEPLPVVHRKRLDEDYRTGFTGTAVRERDAIEHIAGNRSKDGGPRAAKLRKRTRGGLILVFANDPELGTKNMKRAESGTIDPGDLATLFSYALPFAADPNPRVGFSVRQAGGAAIVDGIDRHSNKKVQ